MAEIWRIITKGTWQERRKLAALSFLLAGGWVTLYALAWWIGGGP